MAYEVGFASPAYFSHCFHEYFGYTPGDLRKSVSLAAQESALIEHEQSTSKIKPALLKRSALYAFIILLLLAGGWLIVKQVNGLINSDLSIIVLPFKNLSEAENNQYFADGITEDILNNLYWVTSLRVVSRTSSERLNDTKYTAREIAKQAGVRYILEGSVRRYDGRVRISVQLIDAKKDDHLWSDHYDFEPGDIIDVQGRVALTVANKLKAVLSESEIKKIEKISARNAKAYDYYLHARFLLHRANSSQRTGFNSDGVLNSLAYYEKAIEADPRFAEAYAGLANANLELSAWGIIRSNEGFLKANELSRKAIELDPGCAEAHAVLGAFLVWGMRNFKQGGEELRKSIELNPNFATSRQWYAQYLMITGPIKEARRQVDRAVELEPYFWVVANLDAWIAYFEKDYKHSLEVTAKAHEFNPSFASNLWLSFLNYVKLNEGEKARDQLKSIAGQFSKSDDFDPEIDSAYQASGTAGLFYWLIELNKNSPLPVEGMNGDYFYLAWWNAILQNRDQTLYWLEQNITYKRPNYHFFNLIIYHPDFEFLHNDPRFRQVVDKLEIAEFWPREDA